MVYIYIFLLGMRNSYRENASEISEELRDRDKHPAEESADVIEKAIRRKGVYRHRMAALDLPW